MERKIIDISYPLDDNIAVWEGDKKYSTEWTMKMANRDPVNVGAVIMSLHTGTHADAVYHTQESGQKIDEADVSIYIGLAEVIDCSGEKIIKADNVDKANEKTKRLLFKTNSADIKVFNNVFTYFTDQGAKEIVSRGAVLIGIDTPSVDRADSKTLPVHKIFARGNVAILENLNLQNVEAGTYELIALPLKLVGMDASPVRAVLRELG